MCKNSLQPLEINGLKLYPDYFNESEQEKLLETILQAIEPTPFYQAKSPYTGKGLGPKMTNMGELGWYSDENGYRYQETHPETEVPWSTIPQVLLDVWNDVSEYDKPPQCCLINYYDQPDSKLGLHKDHDEETFEPPIVSISLGDSCLFRMGLTDKKTPTRSFTVGSGAVMVMGKQARTAYHGVDRIMYGENTLLNGKNPLDKGRLSLTLRRVSE